MATNVAASCALGQMAGTMPCTKLAASVGSGPRWNEPEVQVRGVYRPTPEFAMLTYRADATRADGREYSALVSSGYVRRDGEWKLAFHQQAPL